MCSFVHFVGSLPLDSSLATFESISKTNGSFVHSVPDGETGERASFVQWQRHHLPVHTRKPLFGGEPPERYTPGSLTLNDIQPLRYDDFAIQSYKELRQCIERGLFPDSTRLQVCLPSPLDVVRALVETQYCEEVEKLYEERLSQVVQHIQEAIPPESLVIQWDVPIEMAMLEIDRGKLTEPFVVSFAQPYFHPVKAGIRERWKRLASKVHPDVKIGFHLCYGNYKQKHWLEPENVDLMVEVANMLADDIAPIHSVDFVQMPVPKDRTDLAFLEPLKDLHSKDIQLILGLVHGFDLEGTTHRVQAARKVLGDTSFGIATECGMTGKSRQYLESVLAISAEIMSKST